jgi:uncharacterized protein (DUF58 family)
MGLLKRVTTWMETRWLSPSYSCWVILGLTACFLLAAANTMAGWLYVLSGIGIALALVAAWLTLQNLQGITLVRQPIYPVTAQEPLRMAIEIRNQTRHPKGMMQLRDRTPSQHFGTPPQISIEAIAPQESYTWHYPLETNRRGIYQWDALELRTGAPLGLFWCRRDRSIPVEVVVYPQILPLLRCPLIDETHQAQFHRELQRDLSVSVGSEGSTRSLRPYRWGDPMRLVHWRTSARYNELRIRELERMSSGQQFVIALDTNNLWQEDDFEQAVIAAISVYTYAKKHHERVVLWTPEFGLTQNARSVQEILAKVMPTSDVDPLLPQTPLIWLTSNANSLASLPEGSRFIYWPNRLAAEQNGAKPIPSQVGLWVDINQPLIEQLQKALY